MWDGGYDSEKKRTRTAGLPCSPGRHSGWGNNWEPSATLDPILKYISMKSLGCTLLACLRTLFCVSPIGGRVRLCLAGGTETGQPISRDLQSGCSDTNARADDRPAEDVSHGQSGHHTSVWRGRASQVCWSHHAGFLWSWINEGGSFFWLQMLRQEVTAQMGTECEQEGVEGQGCSSLEWTKACERERESG